MNRKFLLLSALLSALLVLANGRKISLLDKDDMDPEFWLEISCRFMQNLEEYESAECEFKREEAPASLLDGRSGFWGPCSKKTCNIVYYGGSLPLAKSISVTALVGGTGTVSILGQRSPIGNDLEELGKISSPSGLLAITTTVNRNMRFVLNITAEVTEQEGVMSFALIDNIVIDLGDDVPDPTTPPPEPERTLYTIDSKVDLTGLSEFTEVSCNYAEHVDEFWTWGCPQNVEDDGGFGYWTVCHASQCNFVFSSGKGRPKARRISLNGTFQAGGRISVSKKDQKFGASYTTVMSEEMRVDQTGLEFVMDQDCDNEFYNISISAVNGAAMIIDQLEIELFDEYSDVCSSNPNPEIPTAPPNSGGTTTPAGAAQILASSLLLFIAVFCAIIKLRLQ